MSAMGAVVRAKLVVVGECNFQFHNSHSQLHETESETESDCESVLGAASPQTSLLTQSIVCVSLSQ